MEKEIINKKDILNKVTPVIENIAKSLSLNALEVDFVKEAGNWHLKIFILSLDHEITHEDCEKLTKSLDDSIDELIPIHYYLEVSSPGLERKFKSSKEYNFFKGKTVEIKFKKPIDNDIKKLNATIIEHDSGILKVKSIESDKEYHLEDNNISQVRLKANFSIED